jgi:hypothetical protein
MDVSKNMWKLVMLRLMSTITFRFCSDCSQALYNDPEKQTLHADGSVTTRITLCPECVEQNIRANDAAGQIARRRYAVKKDNEK